MTELAASAELAAWDGLAAPGLRLDKRQRAMLKEMGVQVWQPVPTAAALPTTLPTTLPAALPATLPTALAAATVAKPVAAAPTPAPAPMQNTINSGAVSAHNTRAASTFDAETQPVESPKPGPQKQTDLSSAWRVGKLQTLYGETAVARASRWLILIESPASALQDAFNPFDGEAGKLLDNLLRAAKLHTAGAVLLAPLVRGQAAASDLSAELAATFASASADVALVMGRLAVQALLQSSEPLAKLRGQIQTLHSTPTIVTIDPTYLLRNPLDKARVWDDLCMALGLTNDQ